MIQEIEYKKEVLNTLSNFNEQFDNGISFYVRSLFSLNFPFLKLEKYTILDDIFHSTIIIHFCNLPRMNLITDIQKLDGEISYLINFKIYHTMCVGYSRIGYQMYTMSFPDIKLNKYGVMELGIKYANIPIEIIWNNFIISLLKEGNLFRKNIGFYSPADCHQSFSFDTVEEKGNMLKTFGRLLTDLS